MVGPSESRPPMGHRKSDLGIPCPRKICQSSARPPALSLSWKRYRLIQGTATMLQRWEPICLLAKAEELESHCTVETRRYSEREPPEFHAKNESGKDGIVSSHRDSRDMIRGDVQPHTSQPTPVAFYPWE